MAFAVVEYVGEDGSNPYKRWFDGLHPQAATKVAAARARLELGNTSNVKRIGAISEYRIDWGPGYRLYLAIEGDTLIILLGGGTKKGTAVRHPPGARDVRGLQGAQGGHVGLKGREV